MARHFTIETVIDKNRVASENVFLMLFEVEVKDLVTGAVIETLRFVKNNENITYRDVVYQASNFDLQIKVESGKEPSVTLTGQDQTRALGQYLDAYDGLMDNDVRLMVVNSGNLNADPEIDEKFKITTAGVDNYVVTIQLGIDSAVNMRWPLHRMFKDKCAWRFKGARCKYVGADTKCDLSLSDCKSKGNELNYGGFPGLNQLF